MLRSEKSVVGDCMVGERTRRCTLCYLALPFSAFSPRAAGAYGLNSRCRKCMAKLSRARRAADPAAARERERAYERRPEVFARTRARHAAREYGIPVEQYLAMVAHQNGCCAVCARIRKLAVDHCHETGIVRALVCYPCNIALGQVNDDIAMLLRLIAYLRQHGDHP